MKNFSPLMLNSLSFLETLNREINSVSFKQGDFNSLENSFLIKGEAMVVINFLEKEITFMKGVNEMFGYTKEEFTLEKLYCDLLHPNQKRLVQRVLNIIIKDSISGNYNKRNNRFTLIHKLKHKDGSYRTILRNTMPFEVGKSNNEIVSVLSIITDITGLINNNKVSWDVIGGEVDNRDIESLVQDVLIQDVFSKREKEILMELKLGLTSKEIANKFFLSSHTVDTHRRNMLRKTCTKNVTELLQVAFTNSDR